MKKLTSIFIFVILSLLVSFNVASAKVIAMENGYYEIKKDEVINDDLFAAAKTIVIDGVINGDVFVAGETVRINGIVNGDLHVGAGTLTLAGTIRDDVYVGAGQVKISNTTIGDSLLIGSGEVDIEDDSTIGGSLIVGSGSFTNKAAVQKSLMVGAGTIFLNSSVQGETRLAGGEISLGPNTKIGKDLFYAIDNEQTLNMSEGASVSGTINRVEHNLNRDKQFVNNRDKIAKGLKSLNLFAKIISYLGAIVVGYLMIKYANKHFIESSKLVKENFFKSLGVGFAVTLLAFPALLLLAITGVGLPLAGILLLILLIKLYLAKLVVGHAVGSFLSIKLGWKNMSTFSIFAFGLLVIYILKFVYVLGFFVSLVVVWVGLGALTLQLVNTVLKTGKTSK